MPDLGEWLECNNCGAKDAWEEKPDAAALIKVLPRGWTIVKNTVAGDALFCGTSCETVWKQTREWQLPGHYRPVEYEEGTLTPDGLSVTAEEALMCECGAGPFKRANAMHGHRSSALHVRRMGGDVSGFSAQSRLRAADHKPWKPRSNSKRAARGNPTRA